MKLNFVGESEVDNDSHNKISQADFFYNEQLKRTEIYKIKVSIKFIQILSAISIVFFIFFGIFQIFQDYQFSTFKKQLITLKNEIEELKLSSTNNNGINSKKMGEPDNGEKIENLNINSINNVLNEEKKKINFSAETFMLKEKFKTEINYLQDCMSETRIKEFEKYENPKISIIVPDYKNERNIFRLIQSVQEQELNEIEIVFLLDNSNKNEFPKLSQLSKIDKRIVILKNEQNKGLLNLYMQGISYVKSNYMMFLEEEGMLLPYLKEIFNNTEVYGKDISDFSSLKGTLNGITFDERINEVEINQPEVSKLYYNKKFINENPLLDKIIKTEIMKNAIKNIKIYFLEEKFDFHVDSLLFICLCTYANTYKSFGNLYGEYHIKSDFSKSNDYLEKMLNSTIYLAKYIYELKCEDEEEFNQRCLLVINLLNWPLNFNKKFKIDVEKSNSVINMFINNDFINKQNKKKMNLIIRKIKDRNLSI